MTSLLTVVLLSVEIARNIVDCAAAHFPFSLASSCSLKQGYPKYFFSGGRGAGKF